MTLREKIELCIRAESDPTLAAVLVIGMIEMQGPEVSGNGWIDDDPVLMGEDGEMDPFNEACERAKALLSK